MNLTLGGAGAPGMKHSDETRKRMSKSHLRLKHKPDVEQRRIERCKERCSKPISLISPDGKKALFPSRRAASQDLGIHITNINRLVNGKYKQIKGWRLTNA